MARRKPRMRRSHLKPFSAGFINTGRSANQQVLKELHQRSRVFNPDDQELIEQFSANQASRREREIQVAANRFLKLFGFEMATFASIYRSFLKTTEVVNRTERPREEDGPIQTAIRLRNRLIDLDKDASDLRLHYAVVQNPLYKLILFHSADLQQWKFVEHDLLNKSFKTSIVYGSRSRALKAYERGGLFWKYYTKY